MATRIIEFSQSNKFKYLIEQQKSRDQGKLQDTIQIQIHLITR